MIVEKFHHMHRGSHDAPALFEWLAERRWLPISVEAIQADYEANGEKSVFLPQPHATWVRGKDRLATASLNGRYWATSDNMKAAGWELIPLFDLGDVLRSLRELGLKCRGCQALFPGDPQSRALVCYPTVYDPEEEALCAVCARAADEAVRYGKSAIERAARMPFLVADARSWVQEMRRVKKDRVPLSVRSGVKVLAELVGSEPPW